MTEGESLFLQGKIDEAYEVLEKEKTGRALYLLGLIEREGYGHRKADEEKSRQFFEEGKKQGSPLCSVALFQGETGKNMWDTVNQDFSRVLLSANHGDVLAMDEAGLFYIGGGVILDYEEGVKWLAKGAFYEYWKALYDLGMFYYECNTSADSEEKAIVCFKKAAEFHDKESQYMLGLMLSMKARTEKDMKEAVSWMETSWEEGNEEAALFLGKLYEGTIDTDIEMAPSPEKARAWFEKAASKGNGEALAELAFFYERASPYKRQPKSGKPSERRRGLWLRRSPFLPGPSLPGRRKRGRGPAIHGSRRSQRRRTGPLPGRHDVPLWQGNRTGQRKRHRLPPGSRTPWIAGSSGRIKETGDL